MCVLTSEGTLRIPRGKDNNQTLEGELSSPSRVVWRLAFFRGGESRVAG